MKHVVVALLLIATASVSGFQCTAPRRLANRCHIPLSGPKQFHLASAEAGSENESAVSKAQDILDEFHESNLPFRIVVIGNGAILETTSKLGPKSKSSVSPKTGEKLLTFASDDASFEFHVKVDQVCKITFVSTERTLPDGNTKVMRVSRFLNEKGEPMCSLILADSSEDAAKWFDKMAEMNGQEVIL